MYISRHDGRNFDNPAHGMGRDKAMDGMGAKAKSHVSSKSEGGEANKPSMQHTSETHGTSPHPTTGVHAVQVHHMGDHIMTHTHHDGGAVEPMNHANMAEAHAHAQSQLPSGADEQQDDAQGDSGMGSDTELAGLGGMTGDAA